MKSVILAGAVILGSTLGTSAAQASLIGTTVSGNLTSYTTFDFAPATVGSGIEASVTHDNYTTISLDVDADGFDLLLHRAYVAGNFTFGPSTLNLSFSDPVIQSVAWVGSGDQGQQGNGRITFTDSSISIDLGFLAPNNNFNPDVDFRYAVTSPMAAAVPEAATWAMMIAGFGATGAAMRRRRHAVLAA